VPPTHRRVAARHDGFAILAHSKADLDIGRIMAKATGSEFTEVREEDLAESVVELEMVSLEC